jgi:hypothetical protein
MAHLVLITHQIGEEIPNMTEKNVFNEMEAAAGNKSAETVSPKEASTNAAPVDYTALSDKALGDKKKYSRQILDGQTVKIKSAELFNADTSKDPISAVNGKGALYHKFNFILTFDCQNDEGLDNREYISGGIQFVNKDGGLSEHQFWYDGSSSQLSGLWEAVAVAKETEPNKLSPREFMGYLNSGVSAVIKTVDIKYMGKTTKKNLVGKFI